MKEVTFFTILAIALFSLGWLSHYLYQEFQNERTLNGVYLHYAENKSMALEYVKNQDASGDWVCVNVAYDMTPKEALGTCQHECSHKAYSEIYAEYCEDNWEECLGLINKK